VRPKGMSRILMEKSCIQGIRQILPKGKRTLGSYSVQWINRKWIIVYPRTLCYKWRFIDLCYVSKGTLGRMAGTPHFFSADS
jgi:hypothetical protein